MTEVKKTLLKEGKTKKIWTTSESPHLVLIENKDTITAGDGVRKDTFESKAFSATATTCNCFEFLNTRGIPTHYKGQVDDNIFKACRVDMIPVECVARRVAFGSYLKRHPDVEEGTRLEKVKVEFFLKNDAQHDPLMVFDKDTGLFNLYQPKVPRASGFISPLYVVFPSEIYDGFADDWVYIEKTTKDIFEILEEAWNEQNVTLVDLKIEFGYSTETGTLLLADVVDNDSWRIWPDGDKSRMMDKEVYRVSETSKSLMDQLKNNYAWVAEATGKF